MNEAAAKLIVRAMTEALGHLEAVATLVESRGDGEDRKVYAAGVAGVREHIRTALQALSAKSPGHVPPHLFG